MKMIKSVALAIVGVLIVIGVLGLVKGLQIGRMTAQGEAFVPPAQTVSAAKVSKAGWETTLTSVGSLEAVQGVTVIAELSGKVTQLAFESGALVSAGQLLLQQDISEEKARLRAAESQVVLARKNLVRAKALYQQKIMPIAELEDSKARYEQAAAEADNIRAIIAKKTVRAPFDGRLGIRKVDLGEVLETGQSIVSLQSLDPIYVNFQLPQQELAKLVPGLVVRAALDTPGAELTQGAITVINTVVDSNTRNVRIQAKVENPKERLRPGMYVGVAVVLPEKLPVLTIPATAVVHAPYSDSVFVVENQEDTNGKPQQVLRQQFVQLGEKRGDFVAVERGLEDGQLIVSTGVFKLRNGQSVVVDNSLAPEFKLAPQPANT